MYNTIVIRKPEKNQEYRGEKVIAVVEKIGRKSDFYRDVISEISHHYCSQSDYITKSDVPDELVLEELIEYVKREILGSNLIEFYENGGTICISEKFF